MAAGYNQPNKRDDREQRVSGRVRPFSEPTCQPCSQARACDQEMAQRKKQRCEHEVCHFGAGLPSPVLAPQPPDVPTAKAIRMSAAAISIQPG